MVVAKNLGHVSTAMVEAHYGHLATSYVSEAIRKRAPIRRHQVERKGNSLASQPHPWPLAVERPRLRNSEALLSHLALATALAGIGVVRRGAPHISPAPTLFALLAWRCGHTFLYSCNRRVFG